MQQIENFDLQGPVICERKCHLLIFYLSYLASKHMEEIFPAFGIFMNFYILISREESATVIS
jgi:hypothetical protein